MKMRLTLIIAAAFATIIPSPVVFSQDLALEEIIVTAQRRSQNLQDVAISVSAFSAEAMEDYGWSDVTLVAQQSPNVNIKYTWGNSMPVYTIRGIGMNSFQASDQSSVGLFVDEVYQTSIATMGAFLFDIDRVEVLRGPQGTLFGRNTNGGAVNYLTQAPTDEQEGFLRLDYGNYDRFELEAAVGGSLGENWSGRASVYTIQQGEGWTYDRTSGRDIGEVDITAFRGQLMYDNGKDFSARFIAFGSQDKSQPQYFQHIGTNDANNPGQSCQAAIDGRLDPVNCVDALGYSDTDGDLFAGDYTDVPSTEIYAGNTLDNENLGFTLLMDKEFDAFDLRSITSYQEYDRFQPKESDGNPLLFLDFLFASQIEAFSQEIRLSSKSDASDLSWILGFYVGTDDVEENPDRVGYLDDLGVRYGLRYSQERLNAGVYGQAIWALSDSVNIEVGARYMYDDVDFFALTYIDLGFRTGSKVEFPQAGCPDPAGVIPLACSLDDKAFTGKIGIDWSPSDNVMWYASYSTGHKPGGFNGGLNTNSELYTPFDEEEVVAFEVGVKSTLWGGRAQFNAAVFDYDYKGLQAATPRPAQNQAGILNFLTNLDEASISGAEAELRLAVTENVELSLGASVLDTENNDRGANFDGPWGRSPRKLANSPEQTYNASLAWNIPMENGGNLRFFTDYWYESDHFKTIVNIRALEVTNQQWNARLTYTTPSDNLSVSIFGKNIADRENVVDTLGAGVSLGWGVLVMGQPQTYGVSLKYRF